MLGLIIVIVVSAILSVILNHFLGRSVLGQVGSLFAILPLGMSFVRPVGPQFVVIFTSLGVILISIARWRSHRTKAAAKA